MKPAWYPRLMTRSEQIIEEEQDGREEVMSKHMPGPWYIGNGRIESKEMPSWRDLNPKASDPPSSRVPVCLFRAPDYSWWSPESIEVLNNINEANATLISSAPEMLEALKLALRLIENMEGKIQKLDYITVTGELERAIAKAEGKNQK